MLKGALADIILVAAHAASRRISETKSYRTCNRVPVGSPSRGRDAVVYVKGNWARPLFFILFLCLFMSLWPFQLYFISYILPTALRFLTLFFQS